MLTLFDAENMPPRRCGDVWLRLSPETSFRSQLLPFHPRLFRRKKYQKKPPAAKSATVFKMCHAASGAVRVGRFPLLHMFRVFWPCRCCRFSCCLDSQFQDTRVHHFTKIWTSSLWGDDCCLACVDRIINGQLGQCMELASACCASPVVAVWLHAMHVLYPRLVGVERARIGGKCLAHVLADRCHPRSQEYEYGRQQLNQESKSVNALTGLVIPQSFSIQHCWRQLGRACKLLSLKLVPYRPAGALESTGTNWCDSEISWNLAHVPQDSPCGIEDWSIFIGTPV